MFTHQLSHHINLLCFCVLGELGLLRRKRGRKITEQGQARIKPWFCFEQEITAFRRADRKKPVQHALRHHQHQRDKPISAPPGDDTQNRAPPPSNTQNHHSEHKTPAVTENSDQTHKPDPPTEDGHRKARENEKEAEVAGNEENEKEKDELLDD